MTTYDKVRTKLDEGEYPLQNVVCNRVVKKGGVKSIVLIVNAFSKT